MASIMPVFAAEIRDGTSILSTFPRGYSAIQDAAEQMCECGFPDAAQACKASMKQILELEQEFKAQVDALRVMQHTYAMPEEEETETDFARKYELAVSQNSTDRPKVEELEAFKDLQNLLDRKAGQAASQDADLQMDDANQLAPNGQCPLTFKPLLEIEEPVEDQKGFVYEKEAIHSHINRSGRVSVRAPSAGTTHEVSISGLRPARKVIRAKSRAAGNTTQAPEEDDDIFDVE